MPPFAVAFIAAAAAGSAIYGLFFSGSKDDDKRSNSSSASPPHATSSTERTLARLRSEVPYSPLYSQPDSLSRGETDTRAPATSASHHDLSHSSRGNFHRASSTSTQAQPSYSQPSSSTHAAEAEAKLRAPIEARAKAQAAKASLATRDDTHHAYRSDPTSRYNEESRATLGTSAHTHGSQPLPTGISQTRNSSTTAVGYDADVHRTGLASHDHVGGSSQTPSASTREQASHRQLPTSSRVTEATAKTQTRHPISDRDGWYHSSVASPHRGSSDTFATSADTHVPHPPQVTSTRISQSTVSTTTTPDHTHGVLRAGLTSHHVGEPGQTPTSTRTEASYLQSPAQLGSRVTQTTVRTNPTVPDYDDYGYRSSVASSNATEPHETFSTSTRVHVPRLPHPQVTSTRFLQSTVSTTAMADYAEGSRRARLAAPDSGDPDSPPTHSRTLSSSSGSDYLGAGPSAQVALRSPGPQSDGVYGTEFEAAENTQDMKAARELRQRARRCKSEMHNARDLARSARRSSDYSAEQMHRQDAIALESEMKSLDKRAAKIIFGEKNKVRGDLLQSGCYAQLCHPRPIRRERSTSTVSMSRKLSSTQRKNSNLPRIETTTRSVSSPVRLRQDPKLYA